MPIGYALLLCIPIGVIFFLIARFCVPQIMGHYGRPERNAALLFALFGAFLIPTLWALGCLSEEFPTLSYRAISFSVLVAEGLLFAGICRWFNQRSKD